MEALKMVSKPKEVTWEYDEQADVLYISFGKPREAVTMDLGGGVLLRYSQDDKNIVGFTILGMKSVCHKQPNVTNQPG